MDNADLRTRVLQHVAAQHGISTAAAKQLVDKVGTFELKATTPLGQVISHMTSANFDKAHSAGVAALDQDVGEAFKDSRLIDRVVRSMQLDQDIGFPEALEQLHKGIDSVVSSFGDPRTLRGALRWSRSTPEDIEANLKLFEQRDEAVQRVLDRELAPLRGLHAAQGGMVLLDQGPGAPADETVSIGQAMHDPVERENRLARARKLDASYGLDAGRALFEREDRRYLEIGQDLVRTMEAAAQQRAAQAKADRVGRQLDAAMRKSADKRQRIRALDAEVAKLEGERARIEPATPTERAANKLKLLDAPPDRDRPILSPVLQERIIELGKERPELEYEERRRIVLEAAEPGIALTCAEWAASGYGADASSREPAQRDVVPEDSSSAMNRRVRDRLRQLGRPESDYPKTLEELLVEDASGVLASGTRQGPLFSVSDPNA